MKKMLMTLAAVAIAATMNAQDDWYGSKAGGFAITFNANPVLNYVGNMFNGTQNNSVAPFEGLDSDNLFGGTTITGKYFLEDNLAVVAGFGFNNKYNVTNNYGDNDDVEKVTDYSRATTTAFELLAGLEYRLQPGKRLQPIFGANFVFVHTNSWNYSTIVEGDGDGNYVYSGAPANKLGLMLNAGVEYFIVPQISVGANLDFALSKTWRHESYDSDPEVKNFSRITTKNTALETGNIGGNISLNFYF